MTQGAVVDRLTVSIIERRLIAIAEEMARKMQKFAYSQATAHLRDLGVSIFDRDGRLVTQSEFGIPVHSGGSNIAVKGILDYIGRDNIYPEDFILGNDPYIVRGGHLPDWSFVRPVFYKGELMFYMYAKTHQYDTGGAYPGGYSPRCYDIHGEGALIPPVKVVERGKVKEDVYAVILHNVRGGSMVRMDNMLVLASMIKAEERIIQMCEEYGEDVVRAAIDETIRLTEEQIRHEISKFPAGVYTARRAADCDGTTRDPVWMQLTLTIKPDVGHLVFDYTDNQKQVDFINVPLALVWAYSIVPLRWTLPIGKYSNQGLYNCVTIKTKKGTILDPVYPATCGGSSPNLGGEIIECVLLALSQAIPKQVPAAWTRHLCPIFSGKHHNLLDPRTGSRKWYHVSLFHSDGSSGAIWGYDGWDNLDDPETAGGIIRAPIEVEEADIPWRWLRCEWLTDSAGDGQFRGGIGSRVEYMNMHSAEEYTPGSCYIITGNSGGEAFAPFGIAGGKGGKKAKMWINRKGKLHRLHVMDQVPSEPGDIVITESSGGGGVGDPLDRDVEKVRMDALNEYISIKKAREVYGVVIDPKTFEVDYGATKELRDRKRKASRVK